MLIQAFRTFWQRCLLIVCLAFISWGAISLPAYAKVDPYIRNYLQVTDPVPVVMNDRGETRLFSAENLIQGKKLFELHCASCHVGVTMLSPILRFHLVRSCGKGFYSWNLDTVSRWDDRLMQANQLR